MAAIRRIAKAKSFEMTLTYEEYISVIKDGRCHYCCAELRLAEYNAQLNGGAYGLDRLDSTIGYRIDNVVACCSRCNFGKSNAFSYEEWYGMTAWLRARHTRAEVAPDASIDLQSLLASGYGEHVPVLQ
jgi:hypothetical protein